VRTQENWSLERSLSIKLALQAFSGLALLSAAIYITTAIHLASRQKDMLESKFGIVKHLLSEVEAGDKDQSSLRHSLDDYFASHDDVGLELISSNLSTVYRSPHPVPANSSRTAEFAVSMPGGSGKDVHARLSLDLRRDEQLLEHLKLTLALSALFGALAISLGGLWQVRRGLAPVQNLVEQTKLLGATNLMQGFDGSAQPDELRPLAEQINKLLTRLDMAYRQMEGFNADVAHELNSPLSTLITSTELTLLHERDPAALLDVLGSNLEELQRMSAIVQDMLFLAHADRGAQARGIQVASLAALVGDVVAYHEAVLAEAQLTVDILGDATVVLDVPLIKRALSNLLDNASRHAPRDSSILVEIRQDADRSLRLAVVNQGASIALEHQPRLFDRFYRADQSRSHADAHHGLGLSIVAAIARMHGGEAFSEIQGEQFTIGMVLPVFAKAS
jgi:two-component system heavy metal sensor histidine kinase CusS